MNGHMDKVAAGILFGLASAWACADSQVGSFSSVVTIQGDIRQHAAGKNVRQDLNVGSASNSRVGQFNSTVSTQGITQLGAQGAQQWMNVGGVQNSRVENFSSNVTAGKVEQIGKKGERQELDIGSVTRSTVTGTANTQVSVGDVRQTGSGEIALGAVKDSRVRDFQSSLSVQGKIEGNNIRMGSVVGQRRYNNDGESSGQEVPPDDGGQSSFPGGRTISSDTPGKPQGSIGGGDGKNIIDLKKDAAYAWIKHYQYNMNKEKLERSEKLQAELAFWQTQRGTILSRSQEVLNEKVISENEQMQKKLAATVDIVVSVLSLNPKFISANAGKDSKVAENLYDGLENARNLINAGQGSYNLFETEQERTAAADKIAGLTKSFLMAHVNPPGAAKEIINTTVSNDAVKIAASEILSLSEVYWEALLKGKPTDVRSFMISQYGELAKAAGNVFLAIDITKKMHQADTHTFIYDYLNAYFYSGRDAKFMEKQAMPMKMNIDEAMKGRSFSNKEKEMIRSEILSEISAVEKAAAVGLKAQKAGQDASTILTMRP